MNTIKNIIKNTLLGIALFSLFVIPMGIVGNIESHYKMNGVISEIHNNEIVVLDGDFDEWVFIADDSTQYKVGQRVELLMFTNFTDNTFYDDEIENVKIKG